MVIKGLDVGYAYTKDNEKRIFKSAFLHSDNSVMGTNKLTIDGINYYLGTGIMTSEVDKTDTELNKACTIYNLILSNVKDVCLTVGLPTGQYKIQKDKLAESVMAYNKCSVMYGNKPYNFKIHDVIVAPQGVSSLYTISERPSECIVVDIGGLTIIPSLVEFDTGGAKIIDTDTWYKGVRTLHSSIMKSVNNIYNLKLDNTYAEKIIKQGLKVKGITQDISFLKPLLQDYIDNIAEDIKVKYPTDAVPIYLTGGGSELLYNAFCRRFNDVHKIANPQFANAIGYHNMGYYKFAQRGVLCG